MSRDFLTFEEFCERVKDEISSLLTEENIENVRIHNVDKNNGKEYAGLVILKKGVNIAPTIYLNQYYDEYANGRFYHNILRDIAGCYQQHKPKENFDVKQVLSFESAKDNIICKLINYESNKNILKDMPHRRVEDLAIIYQVRVSEFSESEIATVKLSNAHMEMLGVDEETLYKVGMENTKRILPAHLEDMLGFLKSEMSLDMANALDMDQEEADRMMENTYGGGMPMYILSNRQKINGAIAVLDPDVMDEVANIVGEKYYVIPSSVHEVLIVPFNGDYDEYINYESIVKEVNATQVSPEDVLSGKMYMVDANNHKFMLAENALKYEMELQKKNEKHPEQNKEIKGPKL